MHINIVFLYYFIHLYINTDSFVSGEYHIKNGHIPSYLIRKFDKIDETVFPREIRIKLSLSRISGTLIYSIDKHLNQFIMGFNHGIAITLKIEFNKQQFNVLLQEICGCRDCRYQTLDLWIKIGNVIYIQCQNRTVVKFEYKRTGELNKDYPIPYSKNGSDNRMANEAHMWLVNFPQYNNVTPNNVQLSGCIFDVLYNDESIVFTEISDNIERRCVTTCDKNICNGGQCYEAYNLIPLCDCTHTFLNGRYCNDAIIPINIRSIKPTFTFTRFKVSWRSSSSNIFILKNEFVQIRLSRADAILSFEYKIKWTTIKETLSESYLPNKEYILIAYFSETNISIKFLRDGLWNNSVVTTNRNLKKERFTSLTLQSGDGVIDFVYKTSDRGHRLQRPIILLYDKLKNVISTGRSNNDQKESPKYTNTEWIVVACVCATGPFVVVIGIYICYYRKLRRRTTKGLKKQKGKYKLIQETEILLPISEVPSLNDYKKEKLIGYGSFGRIYKYKCLAVEEVLQSDQDPFAVDLINKYNKLGSHPRIVRYFGTTNDDNKMCIFTEYLALGSLEDQYKVDGPLEQSIVIRYSKQILQGLEFLHKNEIIHGDIRCYNVLRDGNGNVKLRNFFKSKNQKPMSEGNMAANTSVRNDEIRGTTSEDISKSNTYWMAPETIRGDEYSTNSDIWSLGATIIEMLTANHPYPNIAPLKAMFKIETSNKLEYELKQSISQELQLFIDKMLAPNPFERTSVKTLLKSDFLRHVSD